MWQLMLCLLTANIVPAMITALIQNIQELTCLWPSYVGKKEYVSATGLGETKRSFLPRVGPHAHKRCGGAAQQLFSVNVIAHSTSSIHALLGLVYHA